MKNILMCDPTHYDCTYVINPWMVNNINKVDSGVARTQWYQLYIAVTGACTGTVQAQPARVLVMSPDDATTPDLVFTANAGLVIGNKAIVSRFRHPQRQLETPIYERWFKAQGYDTVIPPDDVIFEGAGDCLQTSNGVRWVGTGWRSTDNVATWLYSQFPDEIFITLHNDQDPRFYHLDTCFAPLSGGTIVWYPPAFSTESQALIRMCGDLIELNDEDAAGFACNMVNVGDLVIVNMPSPELTDALTSRGYRVYPVNMSEFIKAGGSAKCLTLELP